jgi:mono/diheme cytochrome c family protein
MARKLAISIVILVAAGAAAFWFLTIPQTVPASALGTYTPNIVNGRTMFFAGGCAACHATPHQDDRTRLGGGLSLPSPFGTFHVPNISSDAKDGIGGWSEAQFVTAMLKGTSPNGKHYYPAFPYASYRLLGMSDIRDLFAHLKTLPPVEGKAPGHDLPFPFNIRRLLGGWKLLFFDDRPFEADPARSAQWNRGAYLVNAAGHCSECHSPRNLFGAIIKSQRFAGGRDPEGKGSIPNITQAGLKDWSIKEIADLLESGKRGLDSVQGSMADVVLNTKQLPPEDRLAMAVYLKSLPPIEGPKPPEKK